METRQIPPPRGISARIQDDLPIYSLLAGTRHRLDKAGQNGTYEQLRELKRWFQTARKLDSSPGSTRDARKESLKLLPLAKTSLWRWPSRPFAHHRFSRELILAFTDFYRSREPSIVVDPRKRSPLV